MEFPDVPLKREVVRLMICGGLKPLLLAKKLNLDGSTLEAWQKKHGPPATPQKFTPSERDTALRFFADFWKPARAQHQHTAQAQDFPNRRYKMHVVVLLVNGGFTPSQLGQELSISVPSIERWTREMSKRVKRRPFTASETSLRLRLLSAFRPHFTAMDAQITFARNEVKNAIPLPAAQLHPIGPEEQAKEQLQRQVANLAINGGLSVECLAQRLQLPCDLLNIWVRKYVAATKHWPLTIKEVETMLNSLIALTDRLRDSLRK